MRLRTLLVVIASFMFSIAVAQTAPPKPAAKPASAIKPAVASKPALPSAPAAQSESKLSPDAPVITVAVPCDKKPADAKHTATCTQTVTRADFEKLVNAASPQMNPMMRRNFAQNLARLMVYSAEAKRLGLDKSDQAREMLRFATMQVYAQELARKTQEDAAKIPDPELEAYYRDNASKYEDFTLSRIVVPKHGAGKEQAANDDEQKAFAQKIRDRWAAGEDADKLQKEAYERAGNANPTPPVKIGERRRGSLAAAQDAVFSLKVGEVSQPFNEPSASFIYRVESKQIQPLDKARDDIKRTLTSKRLEAAIDAFTKKSTTTLDTTYFEMGTPEMGKPAAAKPAAAPVPAAKADAKPAVSAKEPQKQ